MKHKTAISFLFVVLLLFFPNKSSASWAYLFVVWDGFTYVITDEKVEEVDKKIGAVTRYSDMEGTYSGNFSNAYKKGTQYFSIKGVSTDVAIAVQKEDGTYIKAIRDGEYAGNKSGLSKKIIGSLVGLIALAVIVYALRNKLGFSNSEGQ